MEIAQSNYVGWGVLLVLGVPFCIIVLNELVDRLRAGQSEYGAALRFARDLVLPCLVLVMVLRLVFAVDVHSVPANLVSTLFWVLLIAFIFRATRAVLGNGHYQDTDWRAKTPQLFLRLPPYALIGFIAYHIVQNIWALPVREMATTLGIGSIVIAFALQATLSNLVSGVLLVANSPFKTGDWIKFGDVEGKIIDVNWRYTHIEDWNGDLVVIPNGAISDEAITNHSRPTSNTLVDETLYFSFDVPPNEIKRMLNTTMSKTPGILADPAPAVSLTKLENPVAQYLIEFWIDDYETKPEVLQDCLTRIWYAAQRDDIKIPMQAQKIFAQTASAKTSDRADTLPELEDAFRSLPIFEHMSQKSMDMICETAQIKHYAATERILDPGEQEQGVLIVMDGSVRIHTPGDDDGLDASDSYGIGGLFGETGLFGRAVSPVSAVAEVDCKLLLLPHATFNQVLNQDAKLNDQLNNLINSRTVPKQQKRRPAPRAASGSEAAPPLHSEVTNGD